MFIIIDGCDLLIKFLKLLYDILYRCHQWCIRFRIQDWSPALFVFYVYAYKWEFDYILSTYQLETIETSKDSLILAKYQKFLSDKNISGE